MDDSRSSSSHRDDAWGRLRGSLKGIFDELGGGEAYLRAERGQFFPRDVEQPAGPSVRPGRARTAGSSPPLSSGCPVESLIRAVGTARIRNRGRFCSAFADKCSRALFVPTPRWRLFQTPVCA